MSSALSVEQLSRELMRLLRGTQSQRAYSRALGFTSNVETPRGELARNLGVDRTTLSRWLAGNTEPRLPEFLRLVQVGTQRLMAFVALIVDPRELGSTRAAYEDLRLQEKLA